MKSFDTVMEYENWSFGGGTANCAVSKDRLKINWSILISMSNRIIDVVVRNKETIKGGH